jgi:hypothetical protein
MAKHTAKVVAVLGRTRRVGRWKIADDSLVIAVFGRCLLDLTRAFIDEVDADDGDDEDWLEPISIRVIALFGSVSIVLPSGAQLDPSGMAILASAGVDLPLASEPVPLKPLEIEWTAVLARVRVTESEKKQGMESGSAVEGSEWRSSQTHPAPVRPTHVEELTTSRS